MAFPSFSRPLAWGLCCLALGAAAQPAADAGPVRLSYSSPLAGYRAWADQRVQSWRDANAEVGRIGGWRTYSREAASGEVPPTAPAQAGAHASPTPTHHGHHSHGMGGRP